MKNNLRSAYAVIKGSPMYGDITGRVNFYQTKNGVLVTANISGLPAQENSCGGTDGIFAFHIHSGEACTGTVDKPFADAMGHFNPEGCEHPYHAGDMPPLFSNNGYAYMQFLTNRFLLKDIIGRVVIIHFGVDDFTTQPSGNSGEMIACGKIVR